MARDVFWAAAAATMHFGVGVAVAVAQ